MRLHTPLPFKTYKIMYAVKLMKDGGCASKQLCMKNYKNI